MVHPRTLDTAGVYPPRDEWDIAAYDPGDMIDGFSAQDPSMPVPGDNRSPAYRWGATNRIRDHKGEDDGFDEIRHAWLHMRRSAQ